MHRSSRRRRPVRKRGTQAIRRALLSTRNPTRPGETPSGRTAAMGCTRCPPAPRASRIAALQYEERTKNERERTRERCKTRVKSRLIVRLCVVKSAFAPYIYMRRMDFPYKKRIHLGFPYKKIASIHVQNPSQIRTSFIRTFQNGSVYNLAAPCGSCLRQ